MLQRYSVLLTALLVTAGTVPLAGQTMVSHPFAPAGLQFSVPSDWTSQPASGGSVTFVSPDNREFAGMSSDDVNCSPGDQPCLIDWLQNSFPKIASSNGLQVISGSVVAQSAVRNNLRGATFQMASSQGLKLAGFAGYHNGKVFELVVAYHTEAEGYVTQSLIDQVFNSVRAQGIPPPPPVVTAVPSVWRVNKQLNTDANQCIRSAKQALSDSGYAAGNLGDLKVDTGITGGHYVYGTSDHETVGVYCLDAPGGTTWLDVVASTDLTRNEAQPTRDLANQIESYTKSR